MIRRPPRSTLFPYTDALPICPEWRGKETSRYAPTRRRSGRASRRDRKSTRLNSSHVEISYAVFCLKKKKECQDDTPEYDIARTTGTKRQPGRSAGSDESWPLL